MSALGLSLSLRQRRTLPGFSLSLGFTLFYLTSLVLVPLLALVLRPWSLGPIGFWEAVTAPRVLASLRLSFGSALAAALIDSVFGLII
ncbi:MAG: molybdate ABC transporter permease subunit, partial [Alphaproteobacteria bacterium]|nr:molybdate ABC transporter permease subunit [Alphaproteobacteria bacterium]